MLFTFLRVFGCARKMHFPEMLFSWPLNGCKLISVFILPSNRNFLENRERAEGEEDAPARRERERERERERGSRERGRSVRRPTSNPFDFANPDREPRSRTPIANPDREPRSQHRFVVPNREPRSVAPQNRSSSLPSSLNLIGL